MRANGAIHPSLGQRPRNVCDMMVRAEGPIYYGSGLQPLISLDI